MMERRDRFGAKRAGEREGEGQRLPLAIDKGGRSGCAQGVHPGRPLPLLLGLTGCILAAYWLGREASELSEGAKRPSGAERSEAERSRGRLRLRLSVTTFQLEGCTLF